MLWEPFSPRGAGLYRTTRNLYKHVHGHVLVFEEENEDLGLTFRYRWSPSGRFGWVRHAELENRGERETTVEVLDGIQNRIDPGEPLDPVDRLGGLLDHRDGVALVAETLGEVVADTAETEDEDVFALLHGRTRLYFSATTWKSLTTPRSTTA